MATADIHPTVAAADFPTLARNDLQPTLAAADFPTVAFADQATISIRDIGPFPTAALQDVAGPGGPGPIGDPQPFQGGFGLGLAQAVGKVAGGQGVAKVTQIVDKKGVH